MLVKCPLLLSLPLEPKLTKIMATWCHMHHMLYDDHWLSIKWSLRPPYLLGILPTTPIVSLILFLTPAVLYSVC